jgi:SAM-dependent methyltransferase
MTSEDVVLMFRNSPERSELVDLAYWDEDVVAAADRFWASEEYQAIRELLSRWLPRRRLRILDLGAGVGFSSYAFARDGHEAIAVEPDPSEVVGRGALLELARRSGLEIRCLDGVGEQLPPEVEDVDLVYTRQVLHHASDLRQMVREGYRMLPPGGFLLATREHVVSRPEDLPVFLERHDTHRYLKNEHAYTLGEYLDAFRAAGFLARTVIGPSSSSINRYPLSDEMFRQNCARALSKRFGRAVARALGSHAGMLWLYAKLQDRKNEMPGRLYSFLLQRPA